jgi:hypothetical protein
MICPKCKIEHNGLKLPPSLQGKIKTCFICYKTTKKKAENIWYDKNKARLNAKRQKKRAENPKETAQEWRDRYARWKLKKKRAKIK